MNRQFLILFLFLMIAGAALGQTSTTVKNPSVTEEEALSTKLRESKAGIGQVEAMLKLSKYYIVREGELKEDLDKGADYARQAMEVSKRLKFTAGYNESMVLIGHAYVERGDSRACFELIQKADDSTKIRLWLLMSYYYYFGGQLIQSLDSAFYCAEQARQLSRKLGPDKELTVHLHFLELYNLENDTANAINEYKEVVRLSRYTSFPDLHLFYRRLSSLQMEGGNYNLALFYALEALKHMQKSGNYKQAEIIYEHLAFVCRNTGQFLKATEYLEMAVSIYKKEHRILSLWFARENIADAMRKLYKNQEALTLVQQTSKEFPPANNDEKLVMLRCLGNCYKALKQYDLAEKYLLEMIEAGEKRGVFDASGYRDIGQFYIEQGQFEKGGSYLRQMLPQINVFTISGQAHIYYLLYKSDSAAGNYLSALNNLVKNKRLDDAVWEESKSRHIREIQIQYETEKKDQELKLKEKEFQLLSHQSRIQQEAFDKSRLALQYESHVKEQDIKLIRSATAQKDKDLQLHQRNIAILRKDALIKQSSLSEANLVMNVTIAGIILTTVIMILLFNQYRVKKQYSRQVDMKNLLLENLLSEKELLLKEIHHRVKNNLQTIISLLETQSMYLKDDALIAIRNSQHRVYAMSLIHQKLYYLDNSSNIDMATYLPELLNYLQSSFDVRNKIRFRTNIEPIHLDISQAIPAGLILNEAITNSIKYAFPHKMQGEIVIEMIRTHNKIIRFSVADNGIGLPQNWNKAKQTSLGIKLMKGLSDDIQAQFSMETELGTKIIVEFEIHE